MSSRPRTPGIQEKDFKSIKRQYLSLSRNVRHLIKVTLKIFDLESTLNCTPSPLYSVSKVARSLALCNAQLDPDQAVLVPLY